MALAAQRMSVLPDGAAAPLVYLEDHDARQRRAIAGLLRADGLRVEEFASAETIIGAVLARAPGEPACVLADLDLPRYGGAGLPHAIAELVHRMPVVLMTATASIPLVVAAMRLGAMDVLEKPPEPGLLRRAMRGALAHAPA